MSNEMVEPCNIDMRRPPERQIRAMQTLETVRVYQAYSPEIARPAVEAQTFVSPFRRERMTWVKPSFTWMGYRSGWGGKPGQERILAIDLSRDGFEWALAHAALSSFEPEVHGDYDAWRKQIGSSPVRIQWDPERTLRLEPLPWRTIQIGLSGEAVGRYLKEWIRRIEDVTDLAHEVERSAKAGDMERASCLAPAETPYAISLEIARRIGVSP
jgi:hypothetical protein